MQIANVQILATWKSLAIINARLPNGIKRPPVRTQAAGNGVINLYT
jgi:hypothetical protein